MRFLGHSWQLQPDALQQDMEILAQVESGREGEPGSQEGLMESIVVERHRAVTPAPDAFPRWGTPQASPGSDNVALASSQSLGQAPSLDVPPANLSSVCLVEWHYKHLGPGYAWQWGPAATAGELPWLPSLSQTCRQQMAFLFPTHSIISPCKDEVSPVASD